MITGSTGTGAPSTGAPSTGATGTGATGTGATVAGATGTGATGTPRPTYTFSAAPVIPAKAAAADAGNTFVRSGVTSINTAVADGGGVVNRIFSDIGDGAGNSAFDDALGETYARLGIDRYYPIFRGYNDAPVQGSSDCCDAVSHDDLARCCSLCQPPYGCACCENDYQDYFVHSVLDLPF